MELLFPDAQLTSKNKTIVFICFVYHVISLERRIFHCSLSYNLPAVFVFLFYRCEYSHFRIKIFQGISKACTGKKWFTSSSEKFDVDFAAHPCGESCILLRTNQLAYKSFNLCPGHKLANESTVKLNHKTDVELREILSYQEGTRMSGIHLSCCFLNIAL